MEEAKKWFGFHPRPKSKKSEYHLWRKWNDSFYDDKYVVRSKNAPIEVKRTGELAFSPSYKGSVSANRYKQSAWEVWYFEGAVQAGSGGWGGGGGDWWGRGWCRGGGGGVGVGVDRGWGGLWGVVPEWRIVFPDKGMNLNLPYPSTYESH
jgi:hypothetical protein